MMASFPLPVRAGLLTSPGASLALGIDHLDAALPDSGLPSGVVELASPSSLGRATTLAIAACVTAQHRSSEAWAAWIDPGKSLYAPGLACAGVDLERLLVVRPEPQDVARVAVRVAQSRIFQLLVIDRGVIDRGLGDRRSTRWSTTVRRLALAAESNEATIVLLSTSEQAQRDLLPTAMRIELSCHDENMRLQITKDRRGRMSGPITVSLSALARAKAA